MREDFNDYLAFLAVAQERSFTKAAARLNISQSTLSHIIRRLEERLGMRLLMRTTRKVALTEIGEKLMAALEPRLDAIETDISALLRFRDTPAGTVRLTVSDHMLHEYIWPALAPVLKNYPDIQVELSQENGFIDIVEGRFDAGVRLGDDVVKDMIAVRIGADWQPAVIGSADYLEKAGTPSHPSELARHSCINIRHSGAGQLYAWEFERGEETLNMKVQGQLIYTSVYPMLASVEAGYGLAYVPDNLAEQGIKQGRWVRILKEWSPVFKGYHLYYPSRRQMSPALRVIIDALRYRSAGQTV
ncbi:LysR family transcriptional regulator [Kluyvera ascorbata]|uniref:LysR family transcriptional regulator n=1 Tax=Kluyvera ascorbata TaxID=51288 RepID=UPI0018A5570E|nr:LysR family transcriptional regulator [Kluyvera ascorbata]BBV66443.1 transcriptional regulator [Klebsiella sp. STW0522-44]MDU3914594.1 LysR family transcriptional regulator [Kluyvera ascorbata]HAT7516309.1 LysR family transcriptional regulator [Kluyvera ascorbata]HCL5622782.1 LysR family transcriptional regulator [Kluyvera ascorbata]HDG1665653.1 LysR family transcriptional regulator [Kluyvera ascorbata]